MKRKNLAIVCLFCMIVSWLLPGCGLIYDSDYRYQQEAEEKGKTLVEALQSKDADTIKGMFSEYALNHIKDFDEKLAEMMQFIQGNVVSVEAEHAGTSGSYGEEFYKSTGCSVVVKTEQKEYELYFIEIFKSDKDSRIGLYSLTISSEIIYDGFDDMTNDKKRDWDAWNAGKGKVPELVCCYYDDEVPSVEQSKEKGERIAQALKAGDIETIKGMFSEDAKTKIDGFDKKAEQIFSNIKGEVVSAKVYDTSFGYSYNARDEAYIHNWIRLKVCTEQAEYVITATDCVAEEQDDKLGILYLEIINVKDIENSSWGIHRDIPDIRYLKDAPYDTIPEYDWL